MQRSLANTASSDDVITSLQNPRIKAARQLHDAAERRSSGKVLLEGVRLLEEALAADLHIEQVFYLPASLATPRIQELLCQLSEVASPVAVSAKVMQSLCATQHPQGIAAQVVIPCAPPLQLHQGMQLLVADAVQDPGNLGSLIRLGKAFAVQAMLLTPGCADPWNDKAVRASMGAVCSLPLYTYEPEALITLLSDNRIPLCIADAQAKTVVWQVPWQEGWALIIGNEGAGVSPALRAAAAVSFAIPMPGGFDSLNAATAAAIALYEASRQVTVQVRCT